MDITKLTKDDLYFILSLFHVKAQLNEDISIRRTNNIFLQVLYTNDIGSSDSFVFYDPEIEIYQADTLSLELLSEYILNHRKYDWDTPERAIEMIRGLVPDKITEDIELWLRLQ